MHVQMKESAAGKDWSCEAGGVIELPDQEGKRLVEEGHAVEVQPPAPPVIERAAEKLAQIGDAVIDVVEKARQETSGRQNQKAQAAHPKKVAAKVKSSAKSKSKKSAKKKAAKAKAADKVAAAKQKAADKAAAAKQKAADKIEANRE